MKRIVFVFAFLLSMHSTGAIAGAAEFANAMSNPPSEYMVSVVLRSNADGIVIKLVHGVKSASSSSEAVGAFSREVLDKFPGYSIIDSLVSVVPDNKKSCGKLI